MMTDIKASQARAERRFFSDAEFVRGLIGLGAIYAIVVVALVAKMLFFAERASAITAPASAGATTVTFDFLMTDMVVAGRDLPVSGFGDGAGYLEFDPAVR